MQYWRRYLKRVALPGFSGTYCISLIETGLVK